MHPTILSISLAIALLLTEAKSEGNYYPQCPSTGTVSSGLDVAIHFIGLESPQTLHMRIITKNKQFNETCNSGNSPNQKHCRLPNLRGTEIEKLLTQERNSFVDLPPCSSGTKLDICILVFLQNDSNSHNLTELDSLNLFKSHVIRIFNDPIIESVIKRNDTMKPSLKFYGSGLDFWKEQGCLKNVPYIITWNNLPCNVSIAETSNEMLLCEMEEVNHLLLKESHEVVVKLGTLSLFGGPVKPEEKSLISKFLPLIITLPIFLVVIAAIVITCYVLRTRSKRTNQGNITDGIVMVPVQNLWTRFRDLSDDLKMLVQQKRIDEKKISMGSEIGAGYFGEVRRAIMIKDGAPLLVAVKFFKDTGTVKGLGEFLREAVLMCHFEHPNVLECYGIYINPSDESVAIIVPYMQESDLRHYVINNKEEVGYTEIVKYSLQIARGMNYLATNFFVHRDLAARNCLINSEHVVKVSDFGMSRMIEDDSDYYRMDDFADKPLPVRWMAPECLEQRIFTVKTDVWAFGILIWELCTKGGFPYSNMDSPEVVQRVKNGYYPERIPEIPQSLYDVMAQCWNFSAEDRPTFSDLVARLENLHARIPRENDANYISVKKEEDYMLPNSPGESVPYDRDTDEHVSPEYATFSPHEEIPVSHGFLNGMLVNNQTDIPTMDGSNYYHETSPEMETQHL